MTMMTAPEASLELIARIRKAGALVRLRTAAASHVAHQLVAVIVEVKAEPAGMRIASAADSPRAEIPRAEAPRVETQRPDVHDERRRYGHRRNQSPARKWPGRGQLTAPLSA
jgi:hypothetical protein